MRFSGICRTKPLVRQLSKLPGAAWQVSPRGIAVCLFRVGKKVEVYMRNKWGRIALALLLAVTIIGSGCSTNWVQQAQEIVAVLMPATTNLVILVATLQGKEISAEDVAVVQKAGSEVGGDLRLILSLIAAYESADQKAKPGI